MQQSKISVLPLLFFLFVMFVSCDTEDPFRFEPPDYSTVPEPYDTSASESIDIDEGVIAYLHEEGYGPFTVNQRSVVSVFLTLRTESGEVLYSTFSNGQTSSANVSIGNSDGREILVQNPYQIFVSYTPGFQKGLLGMKDGERRTIVVSPEQGFQNIPRNSVSSQHLEETLIYDVHITGIGPTKSQ